MIFKQKIFWFIVLTMITLISLFVNYQIYINRNEGYVYTLLAYNSVYYLSDLPAISRFENTGTDSVSVVLSDKHTETSWTITSQDGEYKTIGKSPLIYLPLNGQTYEKVYQVCRESDGFCFSLNLQRQNTGDIQVITSSIPYTDLCRYSFGDFCDISWIDPAEQESVKKILSERLKVDTCTSTLSKIELITSHINSIAHRDTNIGLNFVWNTYTACQIYNAAVEGKTNMTCNEYSEVYYLFANLAGVQSRRVGVVGFGSSDGVVKISGHHFDESYIPEQKKWAFVDITSNKAYVLNDSNEVLNTFEILMANVATDYSGLRAVSLSGDSTIVVPYFDIRQNEAYYFDTDCLVQYKFGDDRFNKKNQLKRYLFSPEPVLSLNYSNNKMLWKYFWLILFAVSFISTFILMILFVIVKLRTRKSKV